MIKDLIGRTAAWMLRKSIGFDTTSVDWYARNGYPQLYALLGGGAPTHTGRTVSEATALNCSTVWACQRVISETVASLPLHVMQDGASGKRVASEHPLDWVLYREPNPEMSALRARQTLTAHVVTWGNAYALKVKRGGTGQTIGLWPWTPDSVRMERAKSDHRLLYIHKDGNSQEKTYEASDVFHLPGLGFDGVKGYSVIQQAKQSIALAQIQDEYVAKFFANGGRKPYYLHKPIKFKDDQTFQKFREGWESTYNEPHKVPILEGDIELKELGMPLEDAQLLASRQFSVPEICRWFRISPHLVGDLSRATFSNIEHLALEFVQQTLMYWLVLWEQEIERQLLTNGEKGRYYAKHNVSALLRGDFKSRMEGYSIGLQNGFMNPDQVADLEDWNPLPNGAGQAYHIQLNMQTLPGTGEPTAAEQAALAKIQQQQQGGANGNQAA